MNNRKNLRIKIKTFPPNIYTYEEMWKFAFTLLDEIFDYFLKNPSKKIVLLKFPYKSKLLLSTLEKVSNTDYFRFYIEPVFLSRKKIKVWLRNPYLDG